MRFTVAAAGKGGSPVFCPAIRQLRARPVRFRRGNWTERLPIHFTWPAAPLMNIASRYDFIPESRPPGSVTLSVTRRVTHCVPLVYTERSTGIMLSVAPNLTGKLREKRESGALRSRLDSTPAAGRQYS